MVRSTFMRKLKIGVLVVAGLWKYLDTISDLKAQVWIPPKEPLPTLEPNSRLHDAGEVILEGQLLGPESLAIKDGLLYTGLMDGRIVTVNPSTLKIEEFFRFNKSCEPFSGSYDEYPPEREPLCGRPLGMRFGKDGSLFVAESYSGLYRITPDGKRGEALVTKVGDRPITFINDLDIASDGTIYFSETSDRWGRNKVILEISATRPVGTLVSFHPDDPEGTIKVNTGFLPCNGVSLSHDEKYVYFISSPRIFRLDRETGKISIALDNTPAVMDNIRRRKNIPYRFVVGCASKRAYPFSFGDALADFPGVRNILAALLPQRILLKVIPRMGMLMEVDLTPGQERVVQTYQDLTKDGIAYVSEAEEHSDGYTYLGTWHEQHLVRAKTEKLFG